MEKKFLDDGKRSSMTEVKQRNLESIGFKWAKRKGNVSWEIKYRELKEYSERHGNCNVPTKYSQNPALGRWVSTQRSEFKKFQQGRSKHMSREKVDKLTAIGFKWEMLQQRSESDDSSDRETDEGL
jgi:Helicase associated domain